MLYTCTENQCLKTVKSANLVEVEDKVQLAHIMEVFVQNLLKIGLAMRLRIHAVHADDPHMRMGWDGMG